MKRLATIALGLAAAAVLCDPAGLAARAPVNITLASLAPEGSIWDLELKQMGSDWRQASNGVVQVRVAPAGRSGSECSVATQLRAGTRPEAAALTTGLGCLDRAFAIFSVPFFFESADELWAVAAELEPLFRARLGAQGVTLVSWGFGGWVHVFSTSRIASLADLRSARLFTSAGDSTAENWYRQNGFRPVVLSPTDIGASLASGGITALPSPPYLALVMQWFRKTPHMLDLPIAPLVGAIVVNSGTWQEVPESVRPALVEAARAMEARLRARIPAQDREAVDEMVARSLEVSPPAAGFRAESAPLVESMRDTWVPADVYDQAMQARSAYRLSRHR